jgi:hypothetical protein
MMRARKMKERTKKAVIQKESIIAFLIDKVTSTGQTMATEDLCFLETVDILFAAAMGASGGG